LNFIAPWTKTPQVVSLDFQPAGSASRLLIGGIDGMQGGFESNIAPILASFDHPARGQSVSRAVSRRLYVCL
jgi:hypothetical protein